MTTSSANSTPKKRRESVKERQALNQATFLKHIADGDTVTAAAEQTGIDRDTPYKWLKDPKFEARMATAEECGNDRIRDEIKRRAFGYDEPIVYQGEVMKETVRKHSDTLLIFLAKARMPDEFKDRHDISGNMGFTGTLEVVSGIDAPPNSKEKTGG